MSTPLGAGKQSKLIAISKVPSFNYTNSKRTRVGGFTLVQTLDNALGTADKTTFNGQPAYLLDQSTQPTCTGDEAGWAGGVKSGTVGGEVKPTSGTSSILVEGKQLVREGDSCTMNNGNAVGTYVRVGVADMNHPNPKKKTFSSFKFPSNWDKMNDEERKEWFRNGDSELLVSNDGLYDSKSGENPLYEKASIEQPPSNMYTPFDGANYAMQDVKFYKWVSNSDTEVEKKMRIEHGKKEIEFYSVVAPVPPILKGAQIAKSSKFVSRNLHKITKHKYVSTGRTEPANLTEKMAMQHVKSKPKGTQIKRIRMNDNKNGLEYKDGWVKNTQTVRTSQGDVEIHYAHNLKTGKNVDFKFKNKPLKD